MSIRNKEKRVVERILYPKWPAAPFDNNYSWLGYVFQQLMDDPLCAIKPMYLWGVIQGVALTKVLNIPVISVVEFGVAGGAGLRSLEHTSERLSEMTGVDIFVYGFDTGIGHPGSSTKYGGHEHHLSISAVSAAERLPRCLGGSQAGIGTRN